MEWATPKPFVRPPGRIVTRNLRDYEGSPILAISPQEALGASS